MYEMWVGSTDIQGNGTIYMHDMWVCGLCEVQSSSAHG